MGFKVIDSSNLSDLWQRSKDMTDNRIKNSDLASNVKEISDISINNIPTIHKVTSIDLYGGGMVEALNDGSAIDISIGDYIYAENDISKTFNFGYEVTKTLKAGYYRVKSVYNNGHAVICVTNSSTVPDSAYGIVNITDLEKTVLLERIDVNTKVNKVTGKGLSANDYTNEDKAKVDNIPTKTSDLENDSDFVSDENYVHTDNNYTNADKEDVAKIDTLETNQTQILSDIEDLESSLSLTSTATGNPISISDSAHVNAEELVVTLEPIQSGSGDPSPENIRPISGYDETSVVVKDTAENPTVTDTYTLQFGDTVYGGTLNVTTGELIVDKGFDVFDGSNDENWGYESSKNRFIYDIAKFPAPIPSIIYDIISNQTQSVSFDALYDNHSISGMAFSNNGKLSIRLLPLMNTVNTIADWKTYLASNPLQVCYELATPYTIQLTPQQIKMLKDNNVLVADGEMNLTYQEDSVVGDVKEWAEEHFIPYNSYNTPPVFGFHIDGNNSDPESRVTYIADNANYTPAYMDYSADKFRYNSWQDAWFIKYCKPCILNQDGTVKAYLNPNDYTKDVDGNTVVIDENLTGANVMIEFPKIWYKVVPDAGDATSASVYFSPVKVDDGYKDYAYIDKDGVHKEHFYMPAYNGSVLSGTTVMRSLSGQAVSKNLDASTEITYAKANGDGWFTEDAGEVMLINFLLILMGKSTDTQTVFGRGIDSGGETAFNNYVTGAGNMKGLFYGTNTGTGLVKVFGIENWWGLQWRRYAGDVLDNGVRKVKLCYGNEDGSTTFDFNIDGTGYVDVGVTPSGTRGGYIRTMKFTHDGMYSAISDGSSSTYYCGGQWFNNAYHTIYALRGGDALGGVRCGAFCVRLGNAPGDRGWSCGADVSYK